MQVSIETTSGLERRMTIVVPSETFEDKVKTKLEDTARQARLDGFRPGKVPIREIRRRFGSAIRQEIAGELMQHAFFDAVQQEDVTPAGTPSLEIVNMDPGVDLEFTATFEVFPTVELAPFSKVSVKRLQADVTEADVDRVVEHLRSQRKTFNPVERGAAEGDQVKIDFTGRLDGDVFDGGSGEDVTFVIGEGRMIEDFDKGVRGASAGETVTFDATFPDDYNAEHLRGKTVQFEVSVKEVAEAELPALDEEFFANFGVTEGGLEAFRAEVRKSMEGELETAINRQLKEQVMAELARLHEIQLPEALVKREIDALRQQMLQQMQMYGQQDGMPDFPDDLFRDEAVRRVKVGLVINEIVDTQELKPSAERVRERIEAEAKNYAQPQQVIDWYYSNHQQLQQIEMAVLEEQVMEAVVEQADVTEVPSDYEAVISGRALGHDHDHDHDHDHEHHHDDSGEKSGKGSD